MGKKYQQCFDLAEIDTNFENVVRHFPMLIYTPVFLAVVAALIMNGILKWDILPQEVVYFVRVFFIAVLLWTDVKGIAPVKYGRCRNKKGEVIFEIITGEQQSVVFEEFVSELRDHIEAAKGGPIRLRRSQRTEHPGGEHPK